ncbi:MAG TPA: TrkA family potassium uptake protein [Symbiobacteriaceae bacterium]|jgi:trk system potassium uptake protein TrkA|nr:TrkA family potassium uptake protein [Symbiobacteriaceae bacterium]
MSRKQIAVLGLGRFGASVARTLVEQGHEVLGIDADADLVDQFSNLLTHTMVADCTDEAALRSLGLRNMDAAVVAIGHDVQASILATVLLKEIGVPLVVAKAAGDLHGRTLAKVGADKVVYPERDMGARVAHSLLTGAVTDYIELSPEITIMEMAAPERIVGKTLRDLNLRARFGLNVMAIKKGEQINAAPLATDLVDSGDVLVLLGSNDSVRRLERMLQG